MLIIGLLVLIWIVFKDWRLPYWMQRENKMTKSEERVFRNEMKQYLRKYPDGIACKFHQDLVEENKAIDDLKRLDIAYRLGKINAIDYEIQAMPLIEKIDTNDL